MVALKPFSVGLVVLTQLALSSVKGPSSPSFPFLSLSSLDLSAPLLGPSARPPFVFPCPDSFSWPLLAFCFLSVRQVIHTPSVHGRTSLWKLRTRRTLLPLEEEKKGRTPLLLLRDMVLSLCVRPFSFHFLKGFLD